MPISDYDPIFKSAADEWNLDPNLLKSVAAQESGGNPKAVSGKNAQGLMQIIPETQKYLGITDPNDPVQSIYGAAKYLSEGLDKEKTPEGALLYYHGGPGWRNSYGPESKAYVPGVTAHYQKFSAASQPAAAPAEAPSHSAMSDDDFLKSTGGQSGAPVDDDAAFLARTGAKAAPAVEATPNPDAGANEYGITEDTGKPQALTPAEKGVSDTANAAIQGAKDGFGSSPIGMSPQTDQSLVNAGVFNGPNEYNPLKAINRAIVTPLAAAGDLTLRSGQALIGAYQRGVSQAGESAGVPQLGRDLAALPEAFPTGDTGGGALMPHAPIGAPAGNPLVREISPAAHDALDAPLSASFRDNPGVTTPRVLTADASKPLAAASPTSVPLGWSVDDRFGPSQPPATQTSRITTSQVQKRDGVGAVEAGRRAAAENAAADQAQSAAPPAPNSVGAAASSSAETGISPKQELAYRATAEGQKLLEPQAIGSEDRNLYVQNSNPNSAEIEQTVNTARELKSAGLKFPEVSQEAREIAADNNDARSLHFGQTAGSDVDVLNAKEARGAQAEQDLAATWAGKKDADVQPVIDAANAIKASQDGKRPLVRNAVDSVTKELFDADGKLETNPEMLYGVRKHIDDLMSKEAGVDDPKSVRALSNLQALKGKLDGVIEKAAPGFGDYLKNFADASKRIDEMEVLQKHEPKLFDAQNRMTYNKVQTMMRQIVDSRQAPGINPYKSITDDTMQRLWALRDDLRRSASAQELARTPGGSDTVQNLLDVMKGVGKSGADMAAHGLIASHAGPLGNLVYHGAKNALTSKLIARSAQKQTARGLELLRPKTPLHNPLAEP